MTITTISEAQFEAWHSSGEPLAIQFDGGTITLEPGCVLPVAYESIQSAFNRLLALECAALMSVLLEQ